MDLDLGFNKLHLYTGPGLDFQDSFIVLHVLS